MLSIWEPDPSAPRQISRRTLLRVGSLAWAGLGLGDLLRGRAAASTGAAAGDSPTNPNTSVIHVILGGGPSHIDMVDLKPDAPAEIRGEFRPIASSVPGLWVGEHLPYLAQAMHHVTLVRSVAHRESSHLPATHWMMTGYQAPGAQRSNLNPYCGAVVSKLRPSNAAGMPSYVSIPSRQILGGPAYLGPACNPFTPESDPNAPNYKVRNLSLPGGMNATRLQDRHGLLRQLDRLRRDSDRYGEFAGLDKFSNAAIEMVTNARAQQAFDLRQESTATRDRYGRTSAGQGCLLARRLVEAGVPFVTVLSGGEWDTHANNFATLKNESLPLVDQALATLVADIHERGLDRRVLVLISGEFGRTPTINAQAGRDHWPGAFSVLFAGGGMKRGHVEGATDRKAMYPTTHPYSPGDVLATLYHFLGIDTSHEFLDHSGRPLRVLSEGQPMHALFA